MWISIPEKSIDTYRFQKVSISIDIFTSLAIEGYGWTTSTDKKYMVLYGAQLKAWLPTITCTKNNALRIHLKKLKTDGEYDVSSNCISSLMPFLSPSCDYLCQLFDGVLWCIGWQIWRRSLSIACGISRMQLERWRLFFRV